MVDDTNVSDEESTPTRAKPVDAKTFIQVYQTSGSVAEVCERTGLQAHTVTQRASVYRTKRGIPLKKMPSSAMGGARQDWDELAELAKSLREEFDENEDDDSAEDDNATEN